VPALVFITVWRPSETAVCVWRAVAFVPSRTSKNHRAVLAPRHIANGTRAWWVLVLTPTDGALTGHILMFTPIHADATPGWRISVLT